MDISRKTGIEKLMSENNHARALTLLDDAINSMRIEHVSYSNEDFVWAISQRSICFRQLGQFPYAYGDAQTLIKKRRTLAVGYLRKAEVELKIGLTGQAVGTLSMWQHRRPSANGDDDSGAKQAIQQLKAAKEKHRTAVNEKRQNEFRANSCGWLLGCTLAAWLCNFSFDVWTLGLCFLFGLGLSYLLKAGVQVLTQLQEGQQRAVLTDPLMEEELR